MSLAAREARHRTRTHAIRVLAVAREAETVQHRGALSRVSRLVARDADGE